MAARLRSGIRVPPRAIRTAQRGSLRQAAGSQLDGFVSRRAAAGIPGVLQPTRREACRGVANDGFRRLAHPWEPLQLQPLHLIAHQLVRRLHRTELAACLGEALEAAAAAVAAAWLLLPGGRGVVVPGADGGIAREGAALRPFDGVAARCLLTELDDRVPCPTGLQQYL